MLRPTLLILVLYIVTASAGRALSVSLNGAHADGDPYTTKVTGPLVPRAAPPDTPPETFTNCSSRHQTLLIASSAVADSLTKAASAYAAANATNTARYAAWFGNFTAERHAAVAGAFHTLSTVSFANYTYTCMTDKQCDALGDVPAFVIPAQQRRVYLCPKFFDARITGAGSQSGTLVGLAALWGGAGAFVAENDDARDLALSNPDIAIYNGPSYQYFAENTDPALA